MLDTLITSKTRIKLLLKFFSHQANASYLRSLAEEFEESTNSVRVELNRLSQAGLLLSHQEGKTLQYQANQAHPMYHQLKGLVSKHLGFDRIVEEVLPRLGDLHVAAVTGDYARGLDTGVIDLALVGRLQMDFTRHLVSKAEEAMGRRIRFGVQIPDLRGANYDFEREHHLILWRKDLSTETST
jgi:predicted transcriptional regulator